MTGPVAMKPLVVFGAGLLAEVVAHVFVGRMGRRVDAHAVDPEHLDGAQAASGLRGRPVMTIDAALRLFPPESHDFFVAIGFTATVQRRQKVLELLNLGYGLPSVVHPDASVEPGVSLGHNTLVQAGAVVAPFADLGDNVILQTSATVSHHARVGSHCFIAPGAVVCGGAEVGEGCFIGAGAIVRDRVRIGAGCIVGMGAVIAGDCAPGGVYLAAPSRRARRHELHPLP